MKKTLPKSKGKPKVKKRTALRKKTNPMTLIGLESLKPPRGARRKKKLLGRGPGSGHGKTSTRGIKGQTSRAGRDFYPGFEGGQTPLIRRIPKRGFSNVSFQDRYQIVNIKDLAKIKEPVIDPQLLEQAGLIKNKDKLTKILGEGELSQPLTVKAHAFSKKAKELVEKAGGKIEIIHA